jgi:hypothetical protein
MRLGRMPALNQFSDVFMIHEFAAVGGGDPLLNFLHEPFIYKFWINRQFHGGRLVFEFVCVNYVGSNLRY